MVPRRVSFLVSVMVSFPFTLVLKDLLFWFLPWFPSFSFFARERVAMLVLGHDFLLILFGPERVSFLVPDMVSFLLLFRP